MPWIGSQRTVDYGPKGRNQGNPGSFVHLLSTIDTFFLGVTWFEFSISGSAKNDSPILILKFEKMSNFELNWHLLSKWGQ